MIGMSRNTSHVSVRKNATSAMNGDEAHEGSCDLAPRAGPSGRGAGGVSARALPGRALEPRPGLGQVGEERGQVTSDDRVRGAAPPVLVVVGVEASGRVVLGQGGQGLLALGAADADVAVVLHRTNLGEEAWPRHSRWNLWRSGSGLATRVLVGLEAQRDRVDAVALVGRGVVALALEDVPEVRAAVGAADLDALHAEGAVLDVLDRVAGQRGVERRPPAVRLELRVAAEELGAAGAAGVDALGLGVGVLAAEGRLGAGLAQHLVLGGRQLRAPLLVGALDGIRLVGGVVVAHALTNATPPGFVPARRRRGPYEVLRTGRARATEGPGGWPGPSCCSGRGGPGRAGSSSSERRHFCFGGTLQVAVVVLPAASVAVTWHHPAREVPVDDALERDRWRPACQVPGSA